jgi:uncharacterized membrane protein
VSARLRRLRGLVARSPGLAVVVVAAVALTLVRGIPVASFAATLLVFLLPGLGVVAALLPRAAMTTWEAATLSVAMSLVLVIGTGLVLNLTPWGLDPTMWTFLMAAITITAATIGMIRRDVAADAGRPGVQRDPARAGVPALPRRREVWQMALAVAIMFMLIGVSRVMVESRPSTFTQLWMVEGATPSAVEIGVRNEEGVPAVYLLELQSNGASVDSIEFALDAGGVWSRVMQLHNAVGDVTAELYRLPDRSRPYRSVNLLRGTPSPSAGAGGALRPQAVALSPVDALDHRDHDARAELI